MVELIFMKIGTWGNLNPFHHSVCLYGYPTVARQQLSKNINTEMNTHKKIEKLLDMLVSMRSMSYQMKVGN